VTHGPQKKALDFDGNPNDVMLGFGYGYGYHRGYMILDNTGFVGEG